METSTIILILLTIAWFCYLAYFIVEWTKHKKEGNKTVRHFINGKQIGEAHKFSEWEKCEVCRHCYYKKKSNDCK